MKKKIEERKLEVEYAGETYKVSFAKMKYFKIYSEEFQKAQEKSESEACEMAQKFLEDHGLPMDVTDEWQPGDVLDIVQVISGQKKI